MATESEKAELARLASGTATQVHVVEFPKLAEALGSKLPYAAQALRDWDEKVEVWRKSIFAQSSIGGSLPKPPSAP